MLYIFVKCLVRLGLLIYFRKIGFSDKNYLRKKGPLLLACNHPNSFLDALILGAYFQRPVHFLARGDAFKSPFAKKILTALKAIPIYRLSEGKEYLALNDSTFEKCTEILKSGGIVLIFSEGLCLNQWQLRPLKKGTARIALSTWKQSWEPDRFKILPVSFNYSTFAKFSKNVLINFGEIISSEDISKDKNEGEQIVELNKLLYSRLERGSLIEKENPVVAPFLLTNLASIRHSVSNTIPFLKEKQKLLSDQFNKKLIQLLTGTKRFPPTTVSLTISFIKIIVLSVPAVVGLLIHLPIYLPLNNLIKTKTKGTVFYHSALFGALIVAYPIYVLIITAIFIVVFKTALFLLLLLALPVLAIIFLIWRESLEMVGNYFRLEASERKKLQELMR